jgi:hypothetical protein
VFGTRAPEYTGLLGITKLLDITGFPEYTGLLGITKLLDITGVLDISGLNVARLDSAIAPDDGLFIYIAVPTPPSAAPANTPPTTGFRYFFY